MEKTTIAFDDGSLENQAKRDGWYPDSNEDTPSDQYTKIMNSSRKGDIKNYFVRLKYDNYQLEKYIKELENENMQLLSNCNRLEGRLFFLESQLAQLQ